jgi:exodeoxyribonuclease VII large subunit
LLYARCNEAARGGNLTAPEVILLVRGGGAWEDLHAFNVEEVARCISRSPVPVIAGVGHETDFTIADFVADVRAATPTAAAELCATGQDALQGRLDAVSERLHKVVMSQLNANAQELDWVTTVLARPDDGVRAMTLRLEHLAQKLGQGVHPRLLGADIALNVHSAALEASCRRAFVRARDTLTARGERLSAANPAQILSRGFAWLEGPQGLVTSARDISVGDAVRATLADGVVELDVTGVCL